MEYAPLIAKFVSIPIAFSIAGYNTAFSQNVAPLLYSQPASVSTPIFKGIYNNGVTHLGPRAAAAVAAFGYLAYNSHNTGDSGSATKRNLYSSAGVLLISGVIVLTRAVMYPGIQRLIEISNEPSLQSRAGVNEEAVKLLKAWVTQNYFRGIIAFAAGAAGLYAALY